MKEWANLTEEGKQILGHIFTDGKVPLKSLFSFRERIGDHEGEFYLCDWSAMSEEQQGKMREFMAKERGILEDEFKKLLDECLGCIPMRRELVSLAISTIPQRYL